MGFEKGELIGVDEKVLRPPGERRRRRPTLVNEGVGKDTMMMCTVYEKHARECQKGKNTTQKKKKRRDIFKF